MTMLFRVTFATSARHDPAAFRRVYLPRVDDWQLFDDSGSRLFSGGGHVVMDTYDPVVPVSRSPDEDMRGAPAALVRAARRAREIAARTGTPLIVVEDGRIVEKFFAIVAGEVVPAERPNDCGDVTRDS